MRRLRLLLAVPLTVFLYANSHAAVTVNCFTGEFVRGTGKPVVESHTFPAMNGQATVKLFNGGHQGSRAERVSSSTVSVNGVLVFGPSSFNQNVSYLEAPITLKQGNNTLELLLNGKPDGKIQIEIVQAAEADYSGTYCLILKGMNSIMATEVDINQSNGTVTLTLADLANVNVTGLLNGDTVTIAAQVPNVGDLNMVMTFSNDGQTVSGTYDIGGGQGTVTGSKSVCANYTYPGGDPICTLPVANLSLVAGGQQYNSVYNGVTHTGLDFEFGTTSLLPNIIAPCDGVIKGINKHAISEGNIIFDVEIRYNQNWGTFIAFEPYSPDPAIADLQEKEIYASINQVVKRGDLLGRLVVTNTDFPHVHWGVYRNDTGESPVCPRDYLTPQAQSQLDALYGSFTPSLYPACLP